jgi:LPS sulfotransferase NodH
VWPIIDRRFPAMGGRFLLFASVGGEPDTSAGDGLNRIDSGKNREVLMPVTSSYFISAMPRTGGHLLCEALESTGIAARPTEYFEPTYEKYWCDRLGVSGNADYFEKVLAFGSTPNGVFGAKVIWPQLEPLKTKLGLIHGSGLSDVGLLRRTFPDLRFIWLKRRDKVRQAVSYYKAVQTDVWHSVKPDSNRQRQTPLPTPERPAPFDFWQIDRYVKYLTESESNWGRYFEQIGLDPFEVVYEDFSHAIESTVLAILDYLNIPIPAGLRIPPPRLQKLADHVSEEWVHRYKELRTSTRGVRRSVNRSYFISSTPRTGSGLLAEALESTQLAGTPREYFDPIFEKHWLKTLSISADTEYFEKILSAGTTHNGVFGAKVHWHQFEHLTTKLRLIHGSGETDLELLRRTFPDLRYVFLTRRDKVRQAVSYYRAIQTGVWWLIRPSANGNQEAPPPVPVPAPPFDFERIDHWVTRLTFFEAEWRRHFERLRVEPFEMVYEDFVGTYESTVLAIHRYLGLPISEGLKVAPPRLQKMADEVSEEWVHRYREIKGQ